MEHTQIDAFETLRKMLPLTRVFVDEKEMRFRFITEAMAKHFELIAVCLILANRLPLVVDVETWSRGGYVFEANLVVAYAPEMEELSCY